MIYNLKIKYKGEGGFWYTSSYIFAENDEEAVQKARLMTICPYDIEKAVLERCIIKFKKVKDISEE